MDSFWKFGPPLPDVEVLASSADPDWQQANPAAIARSLARSQSRPHGNWYVVDASRRIGSAARRFRIAGHDMVAWRPHGQHGEIVITPEACPHMGASLDGACVKHGKLICPWHGLELAKDGQGAWKPYGVHDDGLLTWVRVGPEDPQTPLPVLPERPALYIEGVVRLEAECEPADIIANRLDPWHGVHFHPYSFAGLKLLALDDDSITVRVAKRIVGRLVVETDAVFHSPEPRSIVMTIIAGEGKGSVVETHAAPIDAGRTAIVEATLATSERDGFQHALKVQRLIRPLIERSARRLWVDDVAYAERLYELRQSTPAS
jgi:phenylpropionate dioxygenase-like ring-hydroxylating dioxygenase large terminal subunit